MDKETILSKANKKVQVGEMEKQKINSGNWIAIIIACVIAVAFMIVEGCLGHHTAIFALGAVCFGWASSFYFMQYFKAKRPWQVLIGAVLEAVGFATMVTLYILFNVGVL